MCYSCNLNKVVAVMNCGVQNNILLPFNAEYSKIHNARRLVFVADIILACERDISDSLRIEEVVENFAGS